MPGHYHVPHSASGTSVTGNIGARLKVSPKYAGVGSYYPTRKACPIVVDNNNWIGCDSILSAVTHKLSFRTHMDIFLCFDM